LSVPRAAKLLTTMELFFVAVVPAAVADAAGRDDVIQVLS
jgi:hypothetical protein